MENTNNQNSKKNALLLVVAVAVLGGIGAYVAMMGGNTAGTPTGTPSDASTAPIPKEIALESPDETKQQVAASLSGNVATVDATNAEFEDVRKQMEAAMKRTGSTGALANTDTMAKKVAELKKNGKEYLEDYLMASHKEGKTIDSSKVQTLPLGDVSSFERFLDDLVRYDPKNLENIGKVLISRNAYGIEMDPESFEGHIQSNYKAGTIDYAKLKNLPIRSDLHLLFLMTEAFYSDKRSAVVNPQLEEAVAAKIALIPKGNLMNPRYRNLSRVHSFFQVANGKETVSVARSLRESQLSYLQAGNYPLLTKESDKELFAEGSRLLEKYKEVRSVEEAKSKDYKADLQAAKKLLAKMEGSEDFRKYYMGVANFNYFISSLEILDGKYDDAVASILRNEKYEFVNADGVKRTVNPAFQHWYLSIAQEAKGDSLTGDAAKAAWDEAIKEMTAYSYARPYYVLPREHLKKLAAKRG